MALCGPRGEGWGKRREAQEGGDICIIMANFALLYGRNRASLVAQMVKNPPAMQEPWVQSLGQEDPLEKGMALLLLLHYACLENLMDREG